MDSVLTGSEKYFYDLTQYFCDLSTDVSLRVRTKTYTLELIIKKKKLFESTIVYNSTSRNISRVAHLECMTKLIVHYTPLITCTWLFSMIT